jgi:hypothetical protein
MYQNHQQPTLAYAHQSSNVMGNRLEIALSRAFGELKMAPQTRDGLFLQPRWVDRIG